MGVPSLALRLAEDKIARRVCAVDFEALVGRDERGRGGPAEVVQDGCYGVQLGVDVGVAEIRCVRRDVVAEKPGPHHVVECCGE